jgi:hypothetical protein
MALPRDGSIILWTLVAIPVTCWLCVLLAVPRRPGLGNEVEELVYTRLLGRQQRLVLVATLATVVTLLAAVLALPRDGDGALAAQRPVACGVLVAGLTTCAVKDAEGSWALLERGTDGTWRRVGSVPVPATGVPPVGD